MREAASTGHSDMYRVLERYLARDPQRDWLEQAAAPLRVGAVTLKLALQRLRQRLRELVVEERSDTVSTADDLAREQTALFAILRERV